MLILGTNRMGAPPAAAVVPAGWVPATVPFVAPLAALPPRFDTPVFDAIIDCLPAVEARLGGCVGAAAACLSVTRLPALRIPRGADARSAATPSA